jgi:predicted AlkP superfamily pyrophosphatase or phosphodiesterase
MKVLRLLWLFVLVPACWAADPIQNAVLISCDGLGRDVLRELLDAGKLPSFAAVIKEGSLQEIEVRGHATSTVPGHATMLTGYGSAVHGIRNNRDLVPIPAGLTVFERLEQHFRGHGIHTLMVAGKTRNLGGDPTNGVYWLARQGFDCFQSKDRLAVDVMRTALPVLERRKTPRFFLFLHFPDPDRAGHLYGKDSAEHREAIVACDRAVGRMRAWLQNEQLDEQTRIYISADHAFDDHARTHGKAPAVFLATNDKAVQRGGQLADVPATILSRFGVDISKLKPPLVGRSLVEESK